MQLVLRIYIYFVLYCLVLRTCGFDLTSIPHTATCILCWLLISCSLMLFSYMFYYDFPMIFLLFLHIIVPYVFRVCLSCVRIVVFCRCCYPIYSSYGIPYDFPYALLYACFICMFFCFTYIDTVSILWHPFILLVFFFFLIERFTSHFCSAMFFNDMCTEIHMHRVVSITCFVFVCSTRRYYRMLVICTNISWYSFILMCIFVMCCYYVFYYVFPWCLYISCICPTICICPFMFHMRFP